MSTAVIVLVATGLWRGPLSFGVGVVTAVLTTLLVRRAFGGRTGDTLGAAAVVTELAVCLSLAASWH